MLFNIYERFHLLLMDRQTHIVILVQTEGLCNFIFGPEVQQKKGYFFTSGGHFVQRSRTIRAIMVEAIMGTII